MNVGKVSTVEAKGNVAEVTFNVARRAADPRGRLKVRPRLFLEGNFFVDLHPGSPSAPASRQRVDDSAAQTTTAAQIDEILTSLQSPDPEPLGPARRVRGGAQRPPTSLEDSSQDPDVQGLTGAQAINKTFRYGGKAGAPARSSTRPSSASIPPTSPT